MINCTAEKNMLHKNEKFMVSLVDLEKVLDDDSKKLLPKSGGDCFLKLKLKDLSIRYYVYIITNNIQLFNIHFLLSETKCFLCKLHTLK